MDKDFKKKQLFDDDEPIKANKDKKMDQLNLSNAVSINGCVIEQNDQQVKEFAKYPIEENLSDALKKMGYIYPTKIQSKALQHSLGDGDLLCLSETGSGKTLSFLIPIVNFILRNIEQAKPGMALILAPTRQLCLQIQDYLIRFRQQDLSQCTSVVLHGGADTKMKQVLQLTKKPRIIIGTPGRILDHLQNTKGFNLKNMKYLILDEADKLLNLDFQKQINQILQLIPKQNRNAYLYSATLTSKVDKLQRVSLHNPTRIQVNSKYHTVQQLDQSFIFIPSKWKDCYLVYLLNRFKQERAIIFVKTCLGVQRLFLTLKQLNFKCDCLHGQLSQTQRQKSLQKFKRNQIRILVCTDVASRGIDIPDISMVINYDICTPKDYIHRVGRTARIGKQGRAISVVTQYDVETFQQVEKKLGKKINQLKTDKQQALVFLQILERTHQTVSRQMKKKHKH